MESEAFLTLIASAIAAAVVGLALGMIAGIHCVGVYNNLQYSATRKFSEISASVAGMGGLSNATFYIVVSEHRLVFAICLITFMTALLIPLFKEYRRSLKYAGLDPSEYERDV